MSVNRKQQLAMAVLVIGVIAVSASASAVDATQVPAAIAEISIQGNLISFSPQVKADGMALSVSGPDGFYIERRYDSGITPTLSIIDEQLGELADGTYTYELRANPAIDEQTRAALESARTTGDLSIVHKLRSLGKLPATDMVQSGSFTIAGGALVNPLAEEALNKDIIHADDVIINGGSLCVGLDCVNGENFGADTLRLKENNLRIHFNDTSNSGSFPSTDWRIVANDSTNGGASYLAFEDSDAGRYPFKVQANAPSNALLVEGSSGDIGLGTANPVLELHIADGDSPGLRLEQDGSSGFTAQTWDIAGNETNFFVRDVTNGSKLPFKIKPSAPTDSLYVDTDGDIGIGTASPSGSLEVARSTGAAEDMLMLTNNGPTRIYLNNTASASDWRFNSPNNGNFRIADGDTNIEFELDPSGNLTISGTLTTASTTYPDYVFESGYQLMNLDDLSAFISENGHLPNVKPAAAVDGGSKINVTDLQVSLLEKVEELTLYTLDQHKTINELRARISALEAAGSGSDE